MKSNDSFWLLALLLVLFFEPLRDSLWSLLLGADPLVLVVILLAVWKLSGSGGGRH